MIGRARIPMRSATAIVAGVTLVSKGQTPTHLAFLIGYMDGSQVLLPVYGCDDIRCRSGLKGHEMRRELERERERREGVIPFKIGTLEIKLCPC